mmetsp:Transcript_23449/g.67568  ORF Transcript_23449/g.67568 Transcript_23449/m.67568 type:complete len:396 (+) Transcript_23449:1163-2350(+)
MVHQMLESFRMDPVLVGQISTPLRQEVDVIVQHQAQRTVVNLQMRTVRKEVVADHHEHEDNVVDDPVDVVLDLEDLAIGKLAELDLEHLAEGLQFQQLKVVAGVFQHILGLAVAVPAAAGHDDGHLLAEEEEVRLVRDEAEHDEVGVESVQDVGEAGLPVRVAFRRVVGIVLLPAFPDVVHHLVLPLAGDVGSGHHHVAARHPERIGRLLVFHPPLHGNAELEHKVGARRDAVGIELGAVGEDAVAGQDGGGQLLGLLGRAEAAGALLVHLGPGRDAVDGQVQHLSWPYEAVEAIDVAKDLLEHGRLVQDDDLVVVVAVRAGVDDAVHVQVEVVDLPIDVQAVVDPLVDVGVLVGQPTEHFGDAAEGRGGVLGRGRGRIRIIGRLIGIGRTQRRR